MPSHNHIATINRVSPEIILQKNSEFKIINELKKRGLDVIEEIKDAYETLKNNPKALPSERINALISIVNLDISAAKLELSKTKNSSSTKATNVNILVNDPTHGA
jgi:hypothetical protein